jgi:hypothetical protein
MVRSLEIRLDRCVTAEDLEKRGRDTAELLSTLGKDVRHEISALRQTAEREAGSWREGLAAEVARIKADIAHRQDEEASLRKASEAASREELERLKEEVDRGTSRADTTLLVDTSKALRSSMDSLQEKLEQCPSKSEMQDGLQRLQTALDQEADTRKVSESGFRDELQKLSEKLEEHQKLVPRADASEDLLETIAKLQKENMQESYTLSNAMRSLESRLVASQHQAAEDLREALESRLAEEVSTVRRGLEDGQKVRELGRRLEAEREERSNADSALHASLRSLEGQTMRQLKDFEQRLATDPEGPSISAAQWSSHIKAALEAKIKEVATGLQEELKEQQAHLDLHGRRQMETDARLGRERADREALAKSLESKLAELSQQPP